LRGTVDILYTCEKELRDNLQFYVLSTQH
jgi:hypothetical protein